MYLTITLDVRIRENGKCTYDDTMYLIIRLDAALQEEWYMYLTIPLVGASQEEW